MRFSYFWFTMLFLKLVWSTHATAAQVPINIVVNFANGNAVQQSIVSQAVMEWEGLLTNPIGRTEQFTLTVEFLDLGTVTLGQVLPSSITVDDNDVPLTALIQMSTNAILYYDNDTSTSSDIPSDRFDALEVARHEVAHALGFTHKHDAFRRCVDANNQFDCRSVTAALIDPPSHLDEVIHPGDLMNAVAVPMTRLDVSELDIQMLRVSFGYNPGKHAIYLLDRTASMLAPRGTGSSRCSDSLQVARNDIGSFFQAFPPETNSAISVWVFSGTAAAQLTTKFSEKQAALDALNNLDPDGCADVTPLADALCETGLNLVNNVIPFVRDGDASLFVSSDGGENNSSGICSGPDSSVALPPYEPGSWQNRVRSNLIDRNLTITARFWAGINRSVDTETGRQISTTRAPNDQSFFEELSATTGGDFSVANDASTSLPPPILGLPPALAVPAISGWGGVVLALLLLVGAFTMRGSWRRA